MLKKFFAAVALVMFVTGTASATNYFGGVSSPTYKVGNNLTQATIQIATSPPCGGGGVCNTRATVQLTTQSGSQYRAGVRWDPSGACGPNQSQMFGNLNTTGDVVKGCVPMSALVTVKVTHEANNSFKLWWTYNGVTQTSSASSSHSQATTAKSCPTQIIIYKNSAIPDPVPVIISVQNRTCTNVTGDVLYPSNAYWSQWFPNTLTNFGIQRFE